MGDNLFIESSGWKKESETSYSAIRGSQLKTISTVKMADTVFGEGICSLPGKS